MIKRQWQWGFRIEVNQRGWMHSGVFPFTMKVYWDRKEEEEKAARTQATRHHQIDLSDTDWRAVQRNRPAPIEGAEGEALTGRLTSAEL